MYLVEMFTSMESYVKIYITPPQAFAEANFSLYCEVCAATSGDKKDVYDRCVKGRCDTCEECHEKSMCLSMIQDKAF